jgi:hypothetical protein
MNHPAPKGSHPRKSRIFNSRKVFSTFAAFALLALMATSVLRNPSVGVRTALAGGFNGAIYTSTGNGTVVNANLYNLKDDVFLNGGPQNNQASGLPDGTYYFEVTNPSGSQLLSTDKAECRQLIVLNGVVSGYASGVVPNTCTPHANGTPNPANGSIPVQLIPFSDTPNQGGEYKVSLIEQGDTTIIDPDGLQIHRSGSSDKSDNFKVKTVTEIPQTAIGGVKWIDTNHDGILDPGETGRLKDVEINVTVGNDTIQTFTDSAGSWALVFPAGTTYKACENTAETSPADLTKYTQTGPNSGATTTDGMATANNSRCWEGTVGTVDTADLNFGNVICQPVISCPEAVEACNDPGSCSAAVTFSVTAADNCAGKPIISCDHASGSTFALGTTTVKCTATDSFNANNTDSCQFTVTVKDCSVGSISGTKYYDGDTNPLNDSLGIGNWKIVLSGSASGTQYTSGSGGYSFGSLGPGTYTVTEYAPNLAWTLEPPSSQTFTISCSNVSNAFTANFHNYCKSPSGGLTLGFWSNKNGQALETAADFTALNALHLRNANGSDRDFTGTLAQNKTALNSWILSANATNMAYMLSAQLTAMKLNVLHGNVNGDSFALCFGGKINDLMAAAEASLTANPNTTASGAARTYQESLKTCLDNLNNNALVIPPTPCSFGSPY